MQYETVTQRKYMNTNDIILMFSYGSTLFIL